MFDYSTCTDDELERGMEQLHALEAAARHQRLLMAGEYARRKAWRRDGAASMAGWMAMRHGISKRAAREQMRVAEALTQLPAVDAAAAEGRLSWEKLCAVTRVANRQTDGGVGGAGREAVGGAARTRDGSPGATGRRAGRR